MPTLFAESESLALLAAGEKQLLSALDTVIERRGWNTNQLRDYQLRTLKSLLEFAYEHIPLYREKYDAAGFRPDRVQSLDDLPLVPFLTKDELRRSSPRQLRSVKRREPARLLLSSGSTGAASRIYRSEEALWHFAAYDVALYYVWCRGKPIEDCLYFVVPPPGKIGHALSDLLRTCVPEQRLVAVNVPPAELLEKLDEFLPEYISSYPSTVRNLAIAMRRRNRTYDRLRLLHLTSEVIDRGTRSLIGEVFPRAEIVQTYTSTEAGLMGYQCSAGAMHVLEDNVLLEIVDAGGEPTDGPGEVVVTDLTNWATPIIRYRGLGDLSRWSSEACPCGAAGRLLGNLEGRTTELILRPDGNWMSPYILSNALEKIGGIHHCQIIQHEARRLEVLAVRDGRSSSPDEQLAASIEQVIVAAIGGDAACTVRFVSDIPPQNDGHKVPLVVSHVRKSS